jgi:hypothetical protein
MKKRIIASAMLVAFLAAFCPAIAQERITIAATSSEAARGLDLTAVGQLFRDSENLEAFEKALNDPETGINNLDLDGNGEVDYIRVVEEANEGAHLIILQVPLAENEFQDVATIEVENSGNDRYTMQIRGNEVIYGANYYVATPDVYIQGWPILSLFYRPVYRPYRSVFHFGYYPQWWRPFHPVAAHIYRTHTARWTGRHTFTVYHASRFNSPAKVKYTVRNSKLVKTKAVRHGEGTREIRGGDKAVRHREGTREIKGGTKAVRHGEGTKEIRGGDKAVRHGEGTREIKGGDKAVRHGEGTKNRTDGDKTVRVKKDNERNRNESGARTKHSRR